MKTSGTPPSSAPAVVNGGWAQPEETQHAKPAFQGVIGFDPPDRASTHSPEQKARWLNEVDQWRASAEEGEADNYERAAKQIRACITQENTHLFLGNLGLRSLPDAIWEQTQLKQLILGCNQLTSVPEKIGNLRNLTHLVLNGNSIQAIPESIGNLINLEILDLCGHSMNALPATTGNLKKLKFCYLISSMPLHNWSNLAGLPSSCTVFLWSPPEGSLNLPPIATVKPHKPNGGPFLVCGFDQLPAQGLPMTGDAPQASTLTLKPKSPRATSRARRFAASRA
jgi:Leucine-rich repeat (LRR) protein